MKQLCSSFKRPKMDKEQLDFVPSSNKNVCMNMLDIHLLTFSQN